MAILRYDPASPATSSGRSWPRRLSRTCQQRRRQSRGPAFPAMPRASTALRLGGLVCAIAMYRANCFEAQQSTRPARPAIRPTPIKAASHFLAGAKMRMWGLAGWEFPEDGPGIGCSTTLAGTAGDRSADDARRSSIAGRGSACKAPARPGPRAPGPLAASAGPNSAVGSNWRAATQAGTRYGR